MIKRGDSYCAVATWLWSGTVRPGAHSKYSGSRYPLGARLSWSPEMSARCWLTRRASRRLCSRDSFLAWFRSGQVTRRPLLPGDLASIFFLFLIWFSDIESGASNSSFWQSVLTSLEWFSKEQFLFGHWTLDGRYLFRGPKLLTPDLKLTYPRF